MNTAIPKQADKNGTATAWLRRSIKATLRGALGLLGAGACRRMLSASERCTSLLRQSVRKHSSTPTADNKRIGSAPLIKLPAVLTHPCQYISPEAADDIPQPTNYNDMLDAYREPTPEEFDALYYDVGGPRNDIETLPDFIRHSVEYPQVESGTSKFQWLLYRFAQQGQYGLECGVFTGITTIPLAKGLACNGGSLISVDRVLSRPKLQERLEQHNIVNATLCEGDDLTLDFSPRQAWFDLIYIDSSHVYEHTVKELFHFDGLLKDGGVFILHDIVVTKGIGLVSSSEDEGYENSADLCRVHLANPGQTHIADYPMHIPAKNCLKSPVYSAIQTFLSYRPAYREFKNLDWGGLAIIQKREAAV